MEVRKNAGWLTGLFLKLAVSEVLTDKMVQAGSRRHGTTVAGLVRENPLILIPATFATKRTDYQIRRLETTTRCLES